VPPSTRQLPPDLASLPKLLTINEACAFLRVCRSSLYRLIRLRELKTMKYLGYLKIPRTVIDAFLRRHEQ
jgi:excisionase family DNA binding protein